MHKISSLLYNVFFSVLNLRSLSLSLSRVLLQSSLYYTPHSFRASPSANHTGMKSYSSMDDHRDILYLKNLSIPNTDTSSPSSDLQILHHVQFHHHHHSPPKDQSSISRLPPRIRTSLSATACNADHSANSAANSVSSSPNKYIRYTPEQVQALEHLYHECPKPTSVKRQQLIMDNPLLRNIDPKQIKVWFQNRRCREKQKKEVTRLQALNAKLSSMNKLLMEENEGLQKHLAQLIGENSYLHHRMATLQRQENQQIID